MRSAAVILAAAILVRAAMGGDDGSPLNRAHTFVCLAGTRAGAASFLEQEDRR